jgi:hypothetical protein
MDEPKTRREKKGRDKQNSGNKYTSKHIREQENLQSIRQSNNNKKTQDEKIQDKKTNEKNK